MLPGSEQEERSQGRSRCGGAWGLERRSQSCSWLSVSCLGRGRILAVGQSPPSRLAPAALGSKSALAPGSATSQKLQCILISAAANIGPALCQMQCGALEAMAPAPWGAVAGQGRCSDPPKWKRHQLWWSSGIQSSGRRGEGVSRGSWCCSLLGLVAAGSPARGGGGRLAPAPLFPGAGRRSFPWSV